MVKIINGRKEIEVSPRKARIVVLRPTDYGIEQNEVFFSVYYLF